MIKDIRDKYFNDLGISTKIHVPIIFAILTGLIIVSYISYSSINNIEKEVYTKTAINLENTFNSKMESKIDVAISNVLNLANNYYVFNALRNNDRNLALEGLSKLSKKYKDNTKYKNIKIHLHTPDNRSFLRVWRPNRYGDDLSGFRKTILHVQKTKKVLVSIEVGRLGLAIRGISPVLDNGKYIGSVEFIQGLNSISKDLLKENKDMLVVVKKEYIKIAKFLDNRPDVMGGDYVVALKTGAYNQEYANELENIEINDQKHIISKNFYSIKIPIKDFSNNIVGYAIIGEPLKSIRDIIDSSISTLIYQICVMFIIDILILIILLKIISIVILQPLNNLKNGLKSFFEFLSNPKLKIIPITIDTNDEFGEITKFTNDGIKVGSDLHNQLVSLTSNLEDKIQGRTKELDDERKLIESIISSSQDALVVIDTKSTVTTWNESATLIFGYSKEEMIGSSIEKIIPDKFKALHYAGIDRVMGNGEKKLLGKGAIEIEGVRKDGTIIPIDLALNTFNIDNEMFFSANIRDISERKELTDKLKEEKEATQAIHKHTRDSIEYASLIQGALIPQKGAMSPFFKDHFVTWTPKDTVGGDIWLFNKMRHDDECLLFFIDCTGHGVPGAFVTMIVKAVEREIISKLNKHHEIDISPAIIMGYFNKTMKKLLRQESKDSLSNAGWDGGILYYNRRTQIVKFAGAETPLFYVDEAGEFKTIKGNRYSVGYKKCDASYIYKETIIEVKEGMKFFCTTDGYLDQNGGEKDFPFGKKRFSNIIKQNHTEPMAELQNIFMHEMMDYESIIPNNDRNDDMTLIGFEIGKQSDFKEHIVEEIVKYEGMMTQNVIASCMDNIETKILHMGTMGIVSTITIEYCQNMMNYSKDGIENTRDIIPAGEIEVQYINDDYYEIIATNIVSIDDKNKIEPKLLEIDGLDKAGIKKRYRELRKSGQNTHEKGGGIGMYEIAKVSDEVEYKFEAINKDKFYFTMKSIVKSK